mgnify:FL=1
MNQVLLLLLVVIGVIVVSSDKQLVKTLRDKPVLVVGSFVVVVVGLCMMKQSKEGFECQEGTPLEISQFFGQMQQVNDACVMGDGDARMCSSDCKAALDVLRSMNECGANLPMGNHDADCSQCSNYRCPSGQVSSHTPSECPDGACTDEYCCTESCTMHQCPQGMRNKGTSETCPSDGCTDDFCCERPPQSAETCTRYRCPQDMRNNESGADCPSTGCTDELCCEERS